MSCKQRNPGAIRDIRLKRKDQTMDNLKKACNSNNSVLLCKYGNYFIQIRQWDNEGYIIRDFTLFETSNFHYAIDYYNKLVYENQLKEIY